MTAYLRGAAVDANVQEFPAGTLTAQAAATAIGCDLRQIVKSLVFVCEGANILALVPGDQRADETKVAAAAGVTAVRIASADEVLAATGFEPGSVAPFPQRAIWRAFIERTVLQHKKVWIGAGSSMHMAVLAPSDLQRLARANAADLTVRR
ncbi:MAG TPA: YbaK/EbsC family protein [Gaiellaceae bacterium]|nr:YbaK/EbsC family protein [Gaiellaceae bacterium]